MDYEALKKRIIQAVEAGREELSALNDDIADHPELSGEEFQTSRKIVELLRGKGYEVEYPFDELETAFRGVAGSNGHKYKVAIMAEYDALPEVGHACGHCLSGAISCLAAIATKDVQDELDTDIHIIGTPAEETDGAKCKMVKDGVFDGYDMAIMVHLYDQNLVTPRLLALRSDMYTFHGKAAHASASPWEGINAFNAAQLMFHGIDMLRQHVTPDVRIHGIIRDGGEAPNIVPEKVTAELYVRALDYRYMEEVNDKVVNCVKAGCLATGATWDTYSTAATYQDLKLNPTGLDALREIFDELDIPDNGDYDAVFGSADAGNVSYVCPTFHPCLQLAPRGVAIHTREFAELVKTDAAHECLVKGAELIALQIAKIFSDESRIAAMKRDFETA